jgi:hypothetical protein
MTRFNLNMKKYMFISMSPPIPLLPHEGLRVISKSKKNNKLQCATSFSIYWKCAGWYFLVC